MSFTEVIFVWENVNILCYQFVPLPQRNLKIILVEYLAVSGIITWWVVSLREKAGGRIWKAMNANLRDLNSVRYSVEAAENISVEKWKPDLVLILVALM